MISNQFTINHRGTILIDVLLAMSLAIIFISIIAESSYTARKSFESAQFHQALLNQYDRGNFISNIVPYGNDELSQSIFVPATSSPELSFIKIYRIPDDLKIAVGTPLCAVDFSNRETIGTYGYYLSNLSTSTMDVSVSITPIALPINPLLPLTDIEVRNDIAYITADSAVAGDPDFLVIDIKEPKNTKVISSLNTGPGLVSLSLAGYHVYAAAPSTVGELHSIRLNSLSNPILETRYRLPLPYATATPALGSSIFYNAGMIYLGTEKWDGDEFSIIDVSNPSNLVKIGGYENGSKINNIFVRGNLASFAGSGNNQFSFIDIHELANMQLLGNFSPSGSGRQDGKVISYFEGRTAFGRTGGGYNIPSDHELFTWPNRDYFDLSLLPNFTSTDIAGGVYGIVQDRQRLYVATRQLNSEFQIYDRNGLATSSSFSLPVDPETMTCDGYSLYILAHLAPYIYKIDITKN